MEVGDVGGIRGWRGAAESAKRSQGGRALNGWCLRWLLPYTAGRLDLFAGRITVQFFLFEFVLL